MSNTKNFIKEHAPKLGEAIEKSKTTLYSIFDADYIDNEMESDPDFIKKELKKIEQELTKAFGSEYPKRMIGKCMSDKLEIEIEVIAKHKDFYWGYDYNTFKYHYLTEVREIPPPTIEEIAEKAGVRVEQIKKALNGK